jgi:Phage baseplate assembly protein W
MVSDEDNIRQSLFTLLCTSPGERVQCYDYGCSIHHYVFEKMDIETQTFFKEQIHKSIILFETRIILESVIFDTEQEPGALLITLNYIIRKTNRRSNMVYPFYLKSRK